MSARIAWKEGLLLSQHHMQWQVKQLWQGIHNSVSTDDSPYWGIINLTFDTALLTIGQIGLQSCQAIFPNGCYYNSLQTTVLPDSIRVEDKGWVVLTLPSPSHHQSMLSLQEVSCEFDASNTNTLEVVFDKPVLRIVNPGELPENAIPIAEIERYESSGQVILASSFIPTCRFIHASVCFQSHLAAITELVKKLGDHILQLQPPAPYQPLHLGVILQQYLARLLVFSQPLSLSPMLLYNCLMELEHTLFAYQAHHQPEYHQTYLHQDMNATFKPMFARIQIMLSDLLVMNAKCFLLTPVQAGLLEFSCPEKWLHPQIDWIIAVTVDGELLEGERLLHVASAENSKLLLSRGLPGIELTPLKEQPVQIPRQPNTTYYRINRDSAEAKCISDNNPLVIHHPEHSAAIEIAIWTVKRDLS